MKSVKYLLLVVLIWPLGGIHAAQYGPGPDRDVRSGRDRDRSGRLDNITRDLADKADRVWSLVRDRRDSRGQRYSDIYRALRNFAQNTRNYALRVNEAQSETHRMAARQLITETENISRLVNRTEITYLRGDWNTVEDQVDRLSQYYGLPFSPNRNLARTDPYGRGDDRYGRDRDRNGRNDDGGYRSGTFRWRGRVDGSDIIYLQGNKVNIQHLKASSITDASYDLPSPLPGAGVNPQLRKLRGRGRVEIAQQPSPSNNYTVGVRIEDDNGGADLYEFELAW